MAALQKMFADAGACSKTCLLAASPFYATLARHVASAEWAMAWADLEPKLHVLSDTVLVIQFVTCFCMFIWSRPRAFTFSGVALTPWPSKRFQLVGLEVEHRPFCIAHGPSAQFCAAHWGGTCSQIREDRMAHGSPTSSGCFRFSAELSLDCLPVFCTREEASACTSLLLGCVSQKRIRSLRDKDREESLVDL